MNILKKILIVLAILIAIPLIIALFVKKDYDVRREISIKRTNNEVFAFLKYLKNQDKFSRWASMDPNMKKSYRGTDGTVGFVSAWESNADSIGVGEQEIKKIDVNQKIDYELRFKVPYESTAHAFISTTALDSTNTKVIWGVDGKFSYPSNLMTLFFDMDKELGKDLNIGLENLKTILEQQQ